MGKQADPVERLVAEDVEGTVWLRLTRLTSTNLCRRIMGKRAPDLPEGQLQTKANVVASAMRSAIGYWRSESTSLNARILTRYYALLQASIAEQVASPTGAATLEEVQRHTEQGHGIFSLSDAASDGPAGFRVGLLSSGHFHEYAKFLRSNLGSYAFQKRPRDFGRLPADEQAKLVSLSDLLCRVPELQGVVEERLGRPPLSFQVAHAERNMKDALERAKNHIVTTGKMRLFVPPNGPTTPTYATIIPASHSVTVEYLKGLSLPFTNLRVEPGFGSAGPSIVGEIAHPADELWWNHFEHHKSGYCGTSVIAPIWGSSDPLLIHLLILYAGSIVVRYLPTLWRRIEEGDLTTSAQHWSTT